MLDQYTYTLDDYNTFSFSKAIHRLLLAGFVFLNVLVMLLMVTFIPSYYHMLCTKVNSDVNSNIYLSFYWGCALVFFILSMALFLLDLMVYVWLCSDSEICSTELAIGYLVTCISTRFVVTVVELIVCAIVCKRNTITVPIPFQKCTTNVLFCCCCCCCCTSTLKSKAGQTLALWGIVVFVQHITASLFRLFCHHLPTCRDTLCTSTDCFYSVLYHYVCGPLAPSRSCSWVPANGCFLYARVCHCIVSWFGCYVAYTLPYVFGCWCGIQFW